MTTTDVSVQSMMFQSTDATVILLIVLAFILAFILAFSVGANDVANSFGTAVGSKVITVKQAIIIATFLELLGAVLLGMRVSDTIRKDIVNVTEIENAYNQSTNCFYRTIIPVSDTELQTSSQSLNEGVVENSIKLVKIDCSGMVEMVGSASALGGAAVWLAAANVFCLPVSGTHSIVGAMLGFGLTAISYTGIGWGKVSFIFASWFISPLLSGSISCSLDWILRKLVVSHSDSFRRTNLIIPPVLFVIFFVNVFSIFFHPHAAKKPLMPADFTNWHTHVPLWGTVIISSCSGLVSALIMRFLVLPRLKRKINHEHLNCNTVAYSDLENNASNTNSANPLQSSNSTIATASSSGDGGKDDSENLTSRKENVASDPKDDEAVVVITNCVTGTGESITIDTENPSSLVPSTSHYSEDSRTSRLFHSLQVIMSCFGSFSHGANDVSNAVAPLITCWLIFRTGSTKDLNKDGFPWYILVFGGVSIVIGLIALGKRVIKTVGTDLTKITPISAFSIELGASVTVLLASACGIPISTTHCKVGSIVMVGLARSGTKSVNIKLFRNIAISWIVTFPVSALAASMLYLLLSSIFFLIRY